MTDLSNYIRIEGDQVTGNIATLAFDLDVTGEGGNRENDKSPVFRLYAKTPRGRPIEVGGIWQRTNKDGGSYYTLTINTGHGPWYANLGRYPGQDEDNLYVVIPNDYLNSPDRRT